MPRRFGWRSGTLKCQNVEVLNNVTIQNDLVFSDVSAGVLGVTGGIDMTGTTSAVGINMSGGTFSTASIRIGDDDNLNFGAGDDISFEYDEDGTNDFRATTAATQGSGFIFTSGSGATSSAGGVFTIVSGAGGATTGDGGAISLTTGATSNVTSGTASATGAITLTTGAAGTATTGVGADGGAINLTGVVGGLASGATGEGGIGSSISIVTGIGGATTDSAAGVETGGQGGNLVLTGGAGGAIDNASTGTAGAGSDVTITAGAGGAADASSSTGGAGGDLTLTSGTGGVSASGTAGADGEIVLVSTVANPVNATASGIRTIQVVDNVNDTTPTNAELDTAFGTPETLGRGFIGTIDDNDGDAIGYIVWTSDASFYFIIGTKAT